MTQRINSYLTQIQKKQTVILVIGLSLLDMTSIKYLYALMLQIIIVTLC